MRSLRRRPVARTILGAGLGALVVAGLAGCGGDAGSGGGDSRYISGNGAITVVPPEDRGAPIALQGTTLDGEPLNIASYRGNPVVVNVWGSWCPPCRAEAPALKEAHDRLKADGVQFVGINNLDADPESAKAFERTFQVEFPSLVDDDGRLLLSLRGAVPPKAVPTTLVLDAQGRIAARVNGALPSATTLVDLVRDADTPA